MTEPEWEQRLLDVWATIDEREESDFLETIETLVAELPADSAIRPFERGLRV